MANHLKTVEKSCVILIFCRNEIAGKVKTRIASAAGDARALNIYQRLCDITVEAVAPVDAYRIICYDTRIENDDRWNVCADDRWLQHGDDLGARMAAAFDGAFSEGFRKVVLIGTDCPQLTAAILSAAFAELDSNDVVVGPAADGGYYLLGFRNMKHDLFQQKVWGTDTVLAATLADAAERGLTCGLLPVLSDVDTLEDALAFGL